jgi:hypothetical protein
MRAIDSLIAYGHKNLQGTHMTTLEITKATNITPNGDCIVAVNSSKSVSDLNDDLKHLINHSSSKITLTLEVNGIMDNIEGVGDPRLQLTSPEDIVCRKSGFVSNRTLMTKANKAAADMDRRIINALKNPREEVYVTILAEI